MNSFIPSEGRSGVEQLKRSTVIATQTVARLLLYEAEKSRLTHQQLDRIDGRANLQASRIG
jgi:hypothetical protein